MSLIVQKFGGTSVGSVERIQAVARRVLDTQAAGHDVVVVASAMAGETNRLVALAQQIDPDPYSLAYDLLIASGEQVSVSLLSIAMNHLARERGLIGKHQVRARPFLGWQIGLKTDDVYSKARIHQIDDSVLRQEIDRKVIPVVAGFQGVSSRGVVTTLGRGGSDTSAVAVAAALGAECEIYTDVDGVYTTDPRLCSGARKIEKISYDEMMELAGLGAKVLQIRSVELAARHGVPLHVRSSFSQEEGTWVVSKSDLGKKLEDITVAGVAADKDQVKFNLQDLPAAPGLAAKVFGELSKNSIVVDIIVQAVPRAGKLTLSFTVGNADASQCRVILEELKKTTYPEMRIVDQMDLAKVSIVGVGMANHPGVAARMFEILGEQNINIELITTSEIKISCLVKQCHMAQAVEKLHEGFALDRVES